ncbi:MAG: Ca2+-dependent phosphoinositide-specific phospholipase C [Chitinophagales bacterium]
MKKWLTICLAIVALAACKKETPPPAAIVNPQDDSLQLNQIQIIASHNSYHRHTDSTVFSYLQLLKSNLPPQYDPDELDYEHPPIEEQFDLYHVRGLEIDIYNDPKGGAFYYRKINELFRIDPISHIYPLLLPGFKVLHIKDVDYNSHFNTFHDALVTIKQWSDGHPGHLPLFINVESKQDGPSENAQLASLGFKPAPPYDAAAADALDQEIKLVFGSDLNGVLTPDKVRQGAATLNEIAVNHRWPKLRDCRGKVIFIMQGNAVSYYLNGHPSLQGRAMFVYGKPGNPETAFVILNDPTSDFAAIQQQVQQGYIVRTRSDAGTWQARNGDYTDMNNAFASGAQITSTDYERPDPRAGSSSVWTNYQVQLPDNAVGRKNVLNASSVRVQENLLE